MRPGFLQFPRLDGIIRRAHFPIANDAAADKVRALFHFVENFPDVLAQDRDEDEYE